MTTKTKNELKLEDERTYEDVKKSIISKSEEVETKTSEIRSELTVATLILQQKRNKKKKEVPKRHTAHYTRSQLNSTRRSITDCAKLL